MAKTYVVKLEIDGVSESVSSINGLEKAVSQLESELKSADLGSVEFKKLSKELGKAKNELGTFQKQINKLDPKSKSKEFDAFGKGVSNSFGIATKAIGLLGEEGQEIAGLITDAQGGIQKSTVGLIGGFKRLATGVKASSKAMKIAIASTGIGLLVIAVGLLVAYWDDIKGLVSGVTGEQKKLNEEADANVKAQEEALEALSAQENSLRLQGKSEREIRDIKIQQTNEVIKATELQLEQMQLTKEAQIEAAKRNVEIAQGIITFLTLPITTLLAAVDALTYGLSLTGILDEATTLVDDFSMGAANLIFDPEGIETEADEAIKTTLAGLEKLKSSRDGFLLQSKQEDEARAKTSKDEEAAQKLKDEEEADRLLDETLKRQATEWQQLEDLKNELAILALESEFERQQEALKQQEIADLNALNGAENFFEQKALIEQKYIKLNADLVADNDKKQRDLEEANEKAAAEFKEKELKKRLAEAQNILSLGGEKMQKVSKALAIADVTRDSIKSVSTQISSLGEANAKSVAASPLTAGMPFVAFNTAKAALSIGSTIASAAKSIQAIRSGGTSGGGGASDLGGGGGGGAPNLGTPEQTANIDFGFLGDGDTSQVGETAPVQAYVLGADVSSTLEANQVIKDQSTL